MKRMMAKRITNMMKTIVMRMKHMKKLAPKNVEDVQKLRNPRQKQTEKSRELKVLLQSH